MANNCFDTRLLSYNGTSQPQRALDALLAKAAKVDERETDDLILFTKRYGAYLNYYDLTNAVTDDWQGLMGNDVAVVIASVSDWNTKDYSTFIKHLYTNIINAGNDADAKTNFKLLLNFVFSVASELDTAYRQLTSDIDYYTFLSVSITSKVAAPLSILDQYYKIFINPPLPLNPLIDNTERPTDPTMPVGQVVQSQDFDITTLSAPFKITPPVTAYPITLTGVVHDDINLVLTHNLFTGALQSFTDAIINIVSRSPDYLAQTLSNYPSHTPHYALYLTFLKLFSFAQNHLNNYTKKHLDFYYKDVLRLSNNPAVADYVHLVFELQKNINQHLLPKSTSFKAGKDANSNDLFYALTDNLVVQTAKVQALKSIYLDKDNTPFTLFASPISNSDDGQGAKLLSADKSWFTFRSPKNKVRASIGFAIASNVLYMNEGNREVTLVFTCDSLGTLTNGDLSNIFNIQLTGKKSWYTVANYKPNIISATSFSLDFSIEGDAPAIVPYSAKIHGGNFMQQLPMVQALLTDYVSYQGIKIPIITSVNITVQVTSVKNLLLQNDDGKINPAKPFKPFGDFPEAGAAFIIGSKEIFQKSLTALTINYEWQTQPLYDVTVDISSLAKGNWPLIAGNASVDISPSLSPGIPITAVNTVVQSPVDFTANADYTVTSVDGFIKLGLTIGNYSLDSYLQSITPPSVSVDYNDSTDKNKVTGYTVNKGSTPPPPHPVLTSIDVDYTAVDNITFSTSNFAARANFFYHLEPFGFREMHPSLTDDKLNLLPVFNLDDYDKANHDGGELWIGLSNALADETFSILFQVSDGSANPLKNMTTVVWYYLNANTWLPFAKPNIADQTNNLTRSGLVVVTVPPGATTNNTRADNGLLWIKAVVQKDPDGVCNLIDVDANAAKAQFVQDIPNNIVFTKTLLPNIISKPSAADAALKSTKQPYQSFDGRISETDPQFYLRVSERLRHKHRAITPWDYERLTLQYFPQIFKAKCISHTGFVTDEKTGDPKYAEMLPGHVMVITIPDLTGMTNANLLRPYTSIGLLTEIQDYLQTLTSPFVQLKACNPQFEEVQFDFQVTFRDGYDPDYYTNQLSLDIEQFLTPWAYGNPQAIQFGNTIEKSVVLNYVEERPYVDFVTCFVMNQIILREGSVIKQSLPNVEEAVASTARSILVSYYNADATIKRHNIITPAKCDCNG